MIYLEARTVSALTDTQHPPLGGCVYGPIYTGPGPKEGERVAFATVGNAPAAQPLCQCGDRPTAQCPGEWEPGCDLGANEKFAAPAAQPQGEAVAWMSEDGNRLAFYRHGDYTKPLYTSPPALLALKPLTDERDRPDQGSNYVPGYGYVATAALRAIERAHGIGGGE